MVPNLCKPFSHKSEDGGCLLLFSQGTTDASANTAAATTSTTKSNHPDIQSHPGEQLLLDYTHCNFKMFIVEAADAATELPLLARRRVLQLRLFRLRARMDMSDCS